jgi:quercetin dioxygenase-like cupin family protein
MALSWSVWTGAAIRDTALKVTQSDGTRLPPWTLFSEWPPGAMRRELYGDPSRSPSFLSVRIPAGYTMPFHWHTAVERIYLQEGAMESQLPHASRKALNEGGALVFPGGRAHSIACVGTRDCLFYLSMTDAIDVDWCAVSAASSAVGRGVWQQVGSASTPRADDPIRKCDEEGK